MVLVQTFGHLEYVLKRTQFAEFREQHDNPISICSLKKGSIDVIIQLVTQVIDLVGEHNIEYLHMGADEVFNFATCRDCKLFTQQASHRILFARWINKVIKRVLKAHPSIKIMAWDDMYRNWSVMDMMLLKEKSQNHLIQSAKHVI